jgi:two-component system, chemotaxis family, sensor histidine kinase and response regulator WspE
MSTEDLSSMSMAELFRVETESQGQVLTAGLLALESAPAAADELEACMRAAHSLKGAARIVGLGVGVRVAHAMEDCFVAAQQGRLTLRQGQIDLLFRGVDLLTRIAQTPEADGDLWAGEMKGEVDAFVAAVSLVGEIEEDIGGTSDDGLSAGTRVPAGAVAGQAPAGAPPSATAGLTHREGSDRVLRVTAENLNRLLALAGESLVESRWLKPFAESLLRLKRLHYGVGAKFEVLHDALPGKMLDASAQAAMADTQRRIRECHQLLSERLAELEMFERRSADLARRLYDEALAVRMRPFADGIRGFPRMVRDVARALGKSVKLEVVGGATEVDRDVLEGLEAPLGHLLRNAIDHGIESPEERRAAGKPADAVVRLEARHSAGMLQIMVSDDGQGMDAEKVRQTVIARSLTNAETAQKLSEAELFEFLFLPGFTMKDTVTDISGRGVGLDAVQNMVKGVRGTVRASSQPGKGARFQLQLPLTLSVVRTLLVEIGGEPYAFPLAYIVRTLKLPKGSIELLEGRQHFSFDGGQIGLVTAHQVLAIGKAPLAGDEWPVIVVGDASGAYGVVVDRFLGERELVVQPLDVRLGKIKDIAAGGLMEDGAPVLIVDVNDLLRSVEKLVSTGHLSKVQRGVVAKGEKRAKRVLVVDDSLTVRVLEGNLLGNRGYEVEAAVDGMDGWNAVRTGHFDLVVTDIDMPRMDGIELVTLIKKDAKLKSLPVMIVSYKDREEDRRRGLEAGADYYLTKGSFHDETLLQAVVDLIGEADA